MAKKIFDLFILFPFSTTDNKNNFFLFADRSQNFCPTGIGSNSGRIFDSCNYSKIIFSLEYFSEH